MQVLLAKGCLSPNQTRFLFPFAFLGSCLEGEHLALSGGLVSTLGEAAVGLFDQAVVGVQSSRF